MVDIKIKEKDKIKIKKLDKAKLYSQKLKKNRFNLKEKAEKNDKKEENTPTEYASNRIINQSKIILYKGTKQFYSYGKKSTQKTKENTRKVIQKIKKKNDLNPIKNKKVTADPFLYVSNKNMEKISENKKYMNLKNHERTVKNISKTSQKITQNTTNIVQEQTKAMKKAYQMTKTQAKKTKTMIKTGIKKSISIMKDILAGTKAFMLAIIAGRLGCSHDDCNYLFYSNHL